VLQRLFTKFPTQINRENILKNREFLSGNREYHLAKMVSVHFSHACSSRFERDLFSPTNFQVEDETSSVRDRYGEAFWRSAPRGLASK
jgi:hypothetical protein